MISKAGKITELTSHSAGHLDHILEEDKEVAEPDGSTKVIEHVTYAIEQLAVGQQSCFRHADFSISVVTRTLAADAAGRLDAKTQSSC